MVTKNNLTAFFTDKTLAWLVYTVAGCCTIYLVFFQHLRGDEVVVYRCAFEQALQKFPALDTQPCWHISPYYLWVVSGLAYVSSVPAVTMARLVPAACFLVGVYVGVLRPTKTPNLNLFLIWLNPYVLVYASRAHPFVPSLLVSFFAFQLLLKKLSSGFLLLAVQVSLQVFTAGVAGWFVPKPTEIKRPQVVFCALLAAAALVGLLATWLAWGGVYPASFLKSTFYAENHPNGTPSWGYLASVPMFAGFYLHLIGTRQWNSLPKATVKAYLILMGVGFVLLTIDDTIWGLISIKSAALGLNGRWISLFVLLVGGLGFFKIERDVYPLFMSLMAAAVLMVTLPFFYERLSIFAMVVPLLSWASLAKPTEQVGKLKFVIAAVFSIISQLLYAKYGAL